AGASPAGLYFVTDEHGAILANDADGDLEILLGRRDESARALNRLGHEGGRPAIRCGLDQVVEVLCAANAAVGVLEPQRAAVAVWRQRVFDARDLRRQHTPRLLPRDRDRALAAACVAVAQRDDFLLPGVDLRQHDRGLVRFRAAGREEALLELAGRDLREAFRHADLLDGRVDARRMD